MTQTTCPRCGSEQIHFVETAVIFFCKNCDHEFRPPEMGIEASCTTVLSLPPDKRLRIFLSYGHDHNEEIVLRIKTDLEALGHEPWIDKDKGIKFGDDWRRAITDGILGSDYMLSFLSKHSTRDPGVCLDEISLALGEKGGIIQTILVESEMEVSPPVSVSHIQWLDMQDWKIMKEKGNEAFEQWYWDKFREIRRVIESDDNQRFAGEIETLKHKLKPVTMDAFDVDLLRQGFAGREWLVEDIRQWLAGPPSDKAFILTGDPGVGKSAFLSWLSHYNKAEVLAAVFIRYKHEHSCDPLSVIKTIAFQIATRLSDYRKLLAELPELDNLNLEVSADDLFASLLTEPLHRCIDGNRKTCVILIDGLDESKTCKGEDISELLARQGNELPPWIRILATARPDNRLMSLFAHMRPRKLHTDDRRNRDDLARYFRSQLTPFRLSEEAIAELVEMSGGVFIYARHVCEEVKLKNLNLDRLEDFPKGLGGVYRQYFERQFPRNDVYDADTLPALQVVLAAVKPLRRDDISAAMQWGDTTTHRFVISLGALFTETSRGLEPFHHSLTEWLTSPEYAAEYYVSIPDGHARLARRGYESVMERVTRMECGPGPGYCEKYAGWHLYRSERKKELRTLFKKMADVTVKGISGYEEIARNLIDLVAKKEDPKNITALKNLIGIPNNMNLSYVVTAPCDMKAAVADGLPVA